MYYLDDLQNVTFEEQLDADRKLAESDPAETLNWLYSDPDVTLQLVEQDD
jgi:hypothetical protein